MYQALYRKYRPKTLEDVVGQKVIKDTLKNAIKNDKISHAYLFTGPRGTGKTSIAKVFAKTINCESPIEMQPCNNCISCVQTNEKQNTDIIEIDAASNNGVDEIREIRNKVMLSSTYGKYKVYIIDEVHMLTIGAFNALLKTLEEPPSHIIFILATTEPHKIPSTILSRCQRFDFKRISVTDIIERLKYICSEENISIEENALYEIAHISEGGMRDSISLLDQTISYADIDKPVTLKDVHEVSGTLDSNLMFDFTKHLLNTNLEQVLLLLQKYDDMGINIKKFAEKIMDNLEKKIISKETPKYLDNIVIDSDKFSELPNVSNSLLLQCIEILNESLVTISNSTNPKLLLELSLIKIIDFIKNEKNTKDNIVLNEVNNKIQSKKEEKKIMYNVRKPEEAIEKPQIENDNINEKNISKYRIKDSILYEKFKIQRINNTLSRFDKKIIPEVRKKIDELKNNIVNPIYGHFIAMFMDSEVKATSDEYIILVFEEQAVSEIFNEQIPMLEKIINKLAACDKKIISTYMSDWDIIKKEFNSKQKQYIYDFETITEEDVFELETKKKDEIQNLFNDCIEYA